MKSKRIDCDLPPSFWCPYPMPEAMALAALRVLSLCEKQLFKSMAIHSSCDCWKRNSSIKGYKNKTQCQLCKRLAGLIPPSWSNMVWKRVSPMDVVAWGQFSHSPVCVLSFFGMVTPKQPNNRVILEQALLLTSEKAVFCNCNLTPHLNHSDLIDPSRMRVSFELCFWIFVTQMGQIWPWWYVESLVCMCLTFATIFVCTKFKYLLTSEIYLKTIYSI